MKIEIVTEPNGHIFQIRDRYMDLVSRTLPGTHVELVGAMAVPMTGRPELDILAIADDINDGTERLKALGFDHRGIADDTSFFKQTVEGVDVTIQVMHEGNKMIETHRNLLLLLREDEVLRKKYEDFKRTLSGLERYEYKKRKVEFLKENILPGIRKAS